MRRVPLTDQRGPPLGYTILPTNETERDPLADQPTGSAARS
jgi:hypothetical protein